MISSKRIIKVFIFSSVHRWDDARIFKKQAQSLACHFDVELHAPAHFEYYEENDVKIFGLLEWEKKSDRFKIIKILFKRLRDSDADIFHFHDPELILMGLYLKIIRRKIVIYDVHEENSKVPYSRVWIPNIIKPVFSYIIRIYEKLFIILFDKIICATPAIKRQFNHRGLHIIQNFPILLFPKEEKQKENIVVYYGDLTASRGIENVIYALKNISKINRTKLVLIGKIREKKVEQLIFSGVDEGFIEFHPWLPQVKLFEITKKCKIAVVLLLPKPAYIESYPVKMFEYMMLGLPILASDFPLWRSIIVDSDCGKVCNPEDPKEIAKTIIEMLGNPIELKKMGKNGKQLVKDKYNWETEEIKLLKIYNELVIE